jgi:hypothetical protein
MKQLMARVGLAIVSALVVALALHHGSGEAAGSEQHLVPRPSGRADANEACISGSVDRASSASDAFRLLPGTVTKRQFLQTYYGECWAEIESQLDEASSSNLEDQIGISSITPWSELAERARKLFVVSQEDENRLARDALDWSADELAADAEGVLRDHSVTVQSMPPDRLTEMRRELESFDAQLRALAAQATTSLDAALQGLWSQRDYQLFPLVLPSIYREPSRKVHLRRFASIGGWHVVLCLHIGDAPDYERDLDAIRKVRDARRGAIAEMTRRIRSR